MDLPLHDAHVWRPGLQARAQAIDLGPGRTDLAQQFDLTRVDRVGDRDRVLVKRSSPKYTVLSFCMLASVEGIAGARPSPRPCGSGSNAHPRSISTRRASPYLTHSHTAFRFRLSLRDIEELLFERGVTVTYAPKEVP
jgi:hypothetical protein